MVGLTQLTPAQQGPSVRPGQFGMAQALSRPAAQLAETALQSEAKPLALKTAERLYDVIGKVPLFNSDIRKLGMSMEDWAARMLTIFSVYLPQGIIAVKEDKHKWETNGRNVVVWVMTFGLTALIKNDRFSINSLLNKFMKPQGALEAVGLQQELVRISKKQADEKLAGLKKNPGGLLGDFKLKRAEKRVAKLAETANKLEADKASIEKLAKATGKQASEITKGFGRLGGNLFQSFEEAGIKVSESDKLKALWASSDINETDRLASSIADMDNKIAELTEKAKGGALSEAEQKTLAALEKLSPLTKQLVRRSGAFRILSTGIITAATVYLIGGVAMKIVYKFIAPFDHDFVSPEQQAKNRAAAKAARQNPNGIQPNTPANGRYAPGLLPQSVQIAPPQGLNPNPSLRRVGFSAFTPPANGRAQG